MATSIGRDHVGPGFLRGTFACKYAYDATGLLAGSGLPSQISTRFWRGNQVVNELRTSASGDSQLTWLCAVGQPIIEQVSGAVARTTLLATAISGSVLLEVDSAVRTVAYAPHGSRPDGDEAGSAKAEPAFNGEPLDAASGCYLLGAGHHRPYSPTLGMFLAPDSASPFGAGGLNTLSYCAGDPINRTDPTGHFWKWIVAGIAVVAAVATLGVMAIAGAAALTASSVVGAAMITASAGLEVAAAAVKDDKLSNILGIAGAVLGVAGGVAAGAAVAKGAATLKARGARFLSRVGGSRRARLGSRDSPLSRSAGAGAGRVPRARQTVDLTGNRFSAARPSPASVTGGMQPEGLVPRRFSRSVRLVTDPPPLNRARSLPLRAPAVGKRVRFDPHVQVLEVERIEYPQAFIRETRRIPEADPADVAALLNSRAPADAYLRLPLSMEIPGRPL